MDNKLGEAINKAIQAHNFDCREEAQAEKREYIELVDSTMKIIIKEEVNTQLPQILPQAISDVATPSLYEAAATLSEFELTKILIDKMEKNKSFDIADYKKELYDVLVKCYNTDKDIFESYGEEAKPSRDSRSKEKKSLSTSKDASKSQHKSSGKSAHAKEPSHTIEDSGVQQDQEFDTGNNDEQPADKEVTKADCQVARAEEPPASFDELNDTSFDFSAFVMNQLKIPNLTQEILVGSAFNLLKGTCKSITELEYYFEECSKATIERLDWHKPENKLYPFNLRKPLSLIQDHRGRQIIPKDYFINNDLEYLKGGDLSRRYSTSVTNTKAATYELKWIKDLVPELWSPVQLKYDQHAYLGTSHWGPKRQSFYGYASNMTSSKDVHFRRRVIAVTRLKIMKKNDYGHLEEIEVRRDDQKLYTFREDRILGTKPHTLHTQYKRKRLMHADELHKFNDGTLNDVRSDLHEIVARIRMEYLPMRKWSNLDKKRARVMGKVPTEMKLVLEQTQQDTSYKVSVSTKGVEELKRKVKIKGEKKEALLTLRQKPEEDVFSWLDEVSLVDGVFDGAFGGVRDEEVVVGEGVVRFSSSFVRLTKSCFGGMMVSLIFLKPWEEEVCVESMVEWFEKDEDDKKSGKDGLFN
ncbi:hypothetical protein Tco_1303193 [Tanacetum coccineum]